MGLIEEHRENSKWKREREGGGGGGGGREIE